MQDELNKKKKNGTINCDLVWQIQPRIKLYSLVVRRDPFMLC